MKCKNTPFNQCTRFYSLQSAKFHLHGAMVLVITQRISLYCGKTGIRKPVKGLFIRNKWYFILGIHADEANRQQTMQYTARPWEYPTMRNRLYVLFTKVVITLSAKSLFKPKLGPIFRNNDKRLFDNENNFNTFYGRQLQGGYLNTWMEQGLWCIFYSKQVKSWSGYNFYSC